MAMMDPYGQYTAINLAYPHHLHLPAHQRPVSAQPLSASSSSDSWNGFPPNQPNMSTYNPQQFPQGTFPPVSQQGPSTFQGQQPNGLGLDIPSAPYTSAPFAHNVGPQGPPVQAPQYAQAPYGQVQMPQEYHNPNPQGQWPMPDPYVAPAYQGMPYPTWNHPHPHPPVNVGPAHGSYSHHMAAQSLAAQHHHAEMIRRQYASEKPQAQGQIQNQDFGPEPPMKPRRRTNREQLHILLRFFNANPKPDTATRTEISILVGMTLRETQVWFQNRRSKIKMTEDAEKRAAKGLPPKPPKPPKSPKSKAKSKAKRGSRKGSRKSSSGSTTTSASSSADPTPEQTMLKLEEEELDDVPVALPSSSSMSSLAPRMVASATAPGTAYPYLLSSEAQATAHRMAGATPLAPAAELGQMAPLVSRRQSIANGELANMDKLASKRKMATLGSAAMARRDSSPYASVNTASESTGAPSFGPGNGLASPLSPSGFKVPSTSLHRAVVHNNTRRCSMPAPPSLVGMSSMVSHSPVRLRGPAGSPAGPFGMDGIGQFDLGVVRYSSPRRTASIHNGEEENAAVAALKKVGSIGQIPEAEDHATPPDAAPTTATTTNTVSTATTADAVTPAEFTIDDLEAFDQETSYSDDLAFLNSLNENANVDGPLPNPAFHFGAAPQIQSTPAQTSNYGSMGPPDDAFTQMQNRNRIGSIASINTFTSETSAVSNDWNVDEFHFTPDSIGMPGFDFDARRASAPDALHHGLNNMGLASAGSGSTTSMPMRPSPLGPNHSVSTGHLSATQMASQSMSSAFTGPSYNSLPVNQFSNANGNTLFPSPMPQGQDNTDIFSPVGVVNNNNMGNMNPRMNGNGNGNPSPNSNGMRRASTIGVGSSSIPHRASSSSTTTSNSIPEPVSTDLFNPEDGISSEILEASITPEDWAIFEGLEGLGDMDFSSIGGI